MLVTNDRFSFQALVDKETERRLLKDEALINKVLTKHGIFFSLSPSQNQGVSGYVRYTMSVRFDPEIIGRGAGRKPKDCPIDMEEALRKEASGKSKQEIASQMGISISTYYRKRKRFLDET